MDKVIIDKSNPRFIRKQYQDRQSWLGGRYDSIGASEAAAALQISPWKTITQLWEEKTRQRRPYDLSRNPYVQRGIREEPKIRAEFIRQHTGCTVHYHEFDILHHRETPFISATLDGEIEITRHSGYLPYTDLRTGQIKRANLQNLNIGVLEIKTGTYSAKAHLKPYINNQVPLHYLAQGCQQLYVTGYDFIIFRTRLFRKDMTFRDGSNNSYLPKSFEKEIVFLVSDPVIQNGMKRIVEAQTYIWKCVEFNRPPVEKKEVEKPIRRRRSA